MIEALTGFQDNIVAFACHGRVTKTDYESVVVPAIEAALARHDKVRVYYEIGTDFQAIDPMAVWEDIKVGLGHLPHWERIAVVSDIAWIRQTMEAFRFLVPGEMKFFPVTEKAAAQSWIAAA